MNFQREFRVIQEHVYRNDGGVRNSESTKTLIPFRVPTLDDCGSASLEVIFLLRKQQDGNSKHYFNYP